MTTPSLQHIIKAICNSDNFNSMKSFRLELNDNGTPVMFQNESVWGFRMNCSQHKRSMAVSCLVAKSWPTNSYLEKIAKWHNRNNEKNESPVFDYLQGELSTNGYGFRDIVVSEWNDDMDTNFSFNIENSVRIVDDVAFSADMTRLIAFPMPQDSVIQSYTIPEGVTTIGKKAFEGCTQVLEVIMPNSVTTIEDEAFYCSYQIKSLKIPESVTHIGAAAFSMIRIQSFHIPYHVKITGGYFIRCPDLQTITLAENHPIYNVVDNVLFSHNKKILLRYPPARLGTTYTIPDGVEMIGHYAFSGCRYLTEIIIPESVTRIGENAFLHCENLSQLNIPNSLLTIGVNAFRHCNKLVNIDLPRNVTFVGDGAFNGCENLNYGFKLALISRFGERVLDEEDE